ncbi:hypothetical protein LINPERHAP1_LOCUS39717 [Linum perenne]
MMEGDI